MAAATNQFAGAPIRQPELPTPPSRRIPTWQIAGLTALLGTIFFYLPLVAAVQAGNAHWPGFMLTGDQKVGYFPSFVEGYRRFWHGGLLGLDFLTEDGASIFAYRPNLLPFYPPFVVAYLLCDCSNLRTAMIAFVAINILHQFLALYFTVVFARRYLGMLGGAGVLAASLYGLSWNVSSYLTEAAFYFQIMLLPVLACALCWLMGTRSRLAPIWMSALFVSYMLSNYAPMMIAGLALAIVAALIAWACRADTPGPPQLRALLRPVVSLLLAGIVCAPYFYAQLQYKKVMYPTADDIEQDAHVLAFNGYDLLNGVSQFLHIHRTHFETMLVWGAIPVFLCLVGLNILITRHATIVPRYRLICGMSALVYLLMLLPTFGTSLPAAADSFYYAIPILGTMHIYQRYLAFAQFFFALLTAALTTIVLLHGSPATKRMVAYGGISIWVGLTAICLIWPPAPPTGVSALLVELFLVAVAAVTVATAPPKPALVVLSGLCAIVGLHDAFTLPLGVNKPTQWATEPDPLGPELPAMVRFVEANGQGKALSKMVIASAEILPSYFNRNLPWLLGSRVKLMNFQGYPPHLSVLANYLSEWGTYGKFAVPWLQQAGADFVFWNDATAAPLSALTDAGFKIGPVLALPAGNHLGRLTLSEIPGADKSPASFENGIFRVSGPATAVKRFKTDYARRILLDLDGSATSTVTYLLWPNPYMIPYLDGKRVAWDHPSIRPVTYDVGPGRHRFEIRFASRSGTAFVWTQAVYWVVIAAAMLTTLARRPAPAGYRGVWHRFSALG